MCTTVGKAKEAKKQLSLLTERAQVAETSVDILQRQLDAKDMLVDSMIEDQQGSRQSSVESLNIREDCICRRTRKGEERLNLIRRLDHTRNREILRIQKRDERVRVGIGVK